MYTAKINNFCEALTKPSQLLKQGPQNGDHLVFIFGLECPVQSGVFENKFLYDCREY